MTIEMWHVPSWEMAAFIKANTRGLGYAKASFAAACMGYDTPCLDIHALVDGFGYSQAKAESVRSGWRQWADYIRDAFLLFDASAAVQWRMFAEWEPVYNDSGHQIYFDALFAAWGGMHVAPFLPPRDMVAAAAAQQAAVAAKAAAKAAKAERAAARAAAVAVREAAAMARHVARAERAAAAARRRYEAASRKADRAHAALTRDLMNTAKAERAAAMAHEATLAAIDNASCAAAYSAAVRRTGGGY
jgi:hypothetical protein